ncbi:hypothetical protein [Acidovorax sp.]|uniref:hypothetical protein n=1 Tax=Acidovorax sp. TaxID=1872122 RepID=UPI0027BAE0E5|nr:hypothetical protein [Acidovorax sp.]
MPSVQANILPLDHLLPRVDPQRPASRAVFIPVDELLTPGFVARHTMFPDFGALLRASAFVPEQVVFLEKTSDDDWEKFIRRVSSFSTWNAMLKDARGEWIMRRLGVCTAAYPSCSVAPTVLNALQKQ